MIASLSGTVQEVSDGHVVLEVGDIGYLVHVPQPFARSCEVGSRIALLTAMVVREESISLYGFSDAQDKYVFDQLLTVSGVGPKLALGIMSELTTARIAEAVSQEDDAVFRAVTGIGSKTAKLIVLSLAGKLYSNKAASPETVKGNTLAALTALGWSERESKEALANLATEQLTDSERLKKALRLLNRSEKK